MASIKSRGKSSTVIYTIIENGKKKQKWETFKTLAEAMKRKDQIENSDSDFIPPVITTVSELIKEYVESYGKNEWAVSTYTDKLGRINNYINPYIGFMRLVDITPRGMDTYYKSLLKKKANPGNCQKSKGKLISPRTVKEIHKILNGAFKQAVRWGYMTSNPVEHALLPKLEQSQKRVIWDDSTFLYALSKCDDPILYLAVNLGFAETLRIGEVVGLRWSRVFIDDESIESNNAYILIEDELTRLNKKHMEELDDKEITFIFPSIVSTAKTSIVITTPKTQSSKRKIWLPKTVALLLKEMKKRQQTYKNQLGIEYEDYDLVFAHENGRPVEAHVINKRLKKLCLAYDLTPITFHAFRHMGTTIKLKITNGDVKSVQGDTGHSQSRTMMDIYAHVLDNERKSNAEKLEREFYCKKPESNIDNILAILKKNPELVSELRQLVDFPE